MSTPTEREEIRAQLQERLDHTPTHKKWSWRLGRRGAFLVMMGVLYFFLGYGYGFASVPPYVYDQLAMPIRVLEFAGVPDKETALSWWGYVWVACGAVAVITAWWPPGRDGWGFVTLIALSLSWSVLNFIGDLALDAQRGWVVGAIFGIYAATIAIVAGMADATPLAKAANE